MLRISSIQVQGFRGIPDILTIDFRPENTKTPASLILSGDNGTGKSSVIDAIEFALQARIARRRDYLDNPTPSAVSLAGSSKCNVTITLSDETIQVREIHKPIDHWVTDWQPHPSFAISPLALRRADILRFWSTPEHQRQVIFFDYVRNPGEARETWTETQEEASQKLSQERLKLKEQRRSLVEQLATRLEMEPKEIPLSMQEFNLFVRDKVYGGAGIKKRRQLQQKGIRIKVDTVAEKLAQDIRALGVEISRLQSEIGPRGQSNSTKLNKQALWEILAGAEARINEAFCRISTGRAFVKHIELVYGKPSEVSLALNVYLNNGSVCSPQSIFSEANLDLLALLVFLSFALESAKRGQAKLLILDDVLQSVDASIRVLVTEYILEQFADWQLIFTVHDRLWLEQLRDLFRVKNHRFTEIEIARWHFETGPVVVGGSRGIEGALKHALARGDTIAICSQAGLLLERICNSLSYTLPISITRRKGDKYTLGDLWPGIFKTLSKTTCGTAVEEVNRWMHLRNLVGAHYNEWAQSISGHEALSFGEAVLQLLCEVQCDECFRWIERRNSVNGGKTYWSCQCGKKKLVNTT